MYHLPNLLLFLFAGAFTIFPSIAAGLGVVRGDALIGHKLRLAIPVDGVSQQQLSRECLRIRAHSTDQTRQYLPPKAGLEVTQENGASVIVVSGGTIHEPVIAFTLAIECGTGLEREYQILADMPSLPLPVAAPSVEVSVQRRAANRASSQVSVPATSTISSSVTPKQSESAPAAVSGEKSQNLLMMSRQRYPGSPRTRERFIRLMLDANPSLNSRYTPLDSAVSLVFPSDLPTLPTPASSSAEKPQQPIETGTASQQTSSARRSDAPLSQPAEIKQPSKVLQRDRLVVGKASADIDAQIMDELVQVIPLMKEQNQFQLALMAKLARMEAEFVLMQQQQDLLEQKHQALEQRFNALEAERLAEKQAAPTTTFGFLELIAATLAGGILGGLSLLALQRRQQLIGPSSSGGALDIFPQNGPGNISSGNSSVAVDTPIATSPVAETTRTPIDRIEEVDSHLHLFEFPLNTLPSSNEGRRTDS